MKSEKKVKNDISRTFVARITQVDVKTEMLMADWLDIMTCEIEEALEANFYRFSSRKT